MTTTVFMSNPSSSLQYFKNLCLKKLITRGSVVFYEINWFSYIFSITTKAKMNLLLVGLFMFFIIVIILIKLTKMLATVFMQVVI